VLVGSNFPSLCKICRECMIQQTSALMSLRGCLTLIATASAVALGAFGAHGLKSRVTEPKRLENWSTAAHYHLIHSLAILIGMEVMHAAVPAAP